MEQGLSETVQEPAYTDAFGSWISAYTPILNSAGESVGGIGQDFPLTYVDEVRSQAVRQVLPVLIISFIVLVGLVLLLSAGIVRPIKRLTAVAARISDGEYNLDLSSMTKVRLRDEMYTLANAVSVMASKIAQREQSLKQEVTRLKVEIDEVRRTEAVKQITESEEFNDLAAKAAEMRKRMTEGRDK
jgi:nitrate/nitrite-specific signal transduction histidine kinase